MKCVACTAELLSTEGPMVKCGVCGEYNWKPTSKPEAWWRHLLRLLGR